MSEVMRGLFDGPEPEPIAVPLDEWGTSWILSDAPRTPSEAIAQAKQIAREQGISCSEATQQVAEQLREISQSA